MVNYILLLAGNLVSIVTVIITAMINDTEYFGLFSTLYSVMIISSSIADYGMSAIGPRIVNESNQAYNIRLSLLFIQSIIVCFVLLFGYSISDYINYAFYNSIVAGAILGFTPVWLLVSIGSIRESYLIYFAQKFSLLLVVVFAQYSKVDPPGLFKVYAYILIIGMLYVFIKLILVRRLNFRTGLSPILAFCESKHYYLQHITGFLSINLSQIIVYQFMGPLSASIYALSDRLSKPLTVLMGPFRIYMLNAKRVDLKASSFNRILISTWFFILLLTIGAFYLLSGLGSLKQYNFFSVAWFVVLMSLNNLALVILETYLTFGIYLHSRDSIISKFSVCFNLFTIMLTFLLLKNTNVTTYLIVLFLANLGALNYIVSHATKSE